MTYDGMTYDDSETQTQRLRLRDSDSDSETQTPATSAPPEVKFFLSEMPV